MQPVAWPEPEPQIAAAIAAKYRGKRPRPLAVQIRDRLGEWLGDEDFAAAFGIRGRPGWSPSRLALVTVLQRAENLTDRLAAESVRTRIDWQYLLGLPLDDPGFDHTVLAEFRGRVADAGLEQVVLDALLAPAGGRRPGQGRRQAAHRLDPCDRRGGGAEPAGAGRRERAGRAGGADRGAPGLGGAAGLRARFRPPLRHPDDLLAARRCPRPGATSWRSPTPATGTRCWRRSTTAPRRPGCARCPPWTCCAGCCCRTTPAPSPETGGR